MGNGLNIGFAALYGALFGTLWWGAYVPAAYSGLLLVFVHMIVAVLYERGLNLVGLGTRVGVLIGLALGLGIAPAIMAGLHEAGILGGKLGFVIDLLAVGAGLFLGGGLGGLFALGKRRALIGALALVGLVAGAWLSARQLQDMTRVDRAPGAVGVSSIRGQSVLMYGIDGADWRVIRPLMARGELPHLAALMARGRHGVLRSLEPMASPVVWTSIFSGMEPPTHGLTDWYRSDARSLRVPMLWDIFEAHGRSTTVVNVPGSWPVDLEAPGTMLAGFPIPGLTNVGVDHQRGQLLSNLEESGVVPTVPLTAVEGGFSVSLSLGAPAIESRFGVSHVLIDTAARKGALPTEQLVMDLRFIFRESVDGIWLEGGFKGGGLPVKRGEWSPWLSVRLAEGTEGVLRIKVMEAAADRLRVYVSPLFQSPIKPRYAFSRGIDPTLAFDLSRPYVVEGIGWTAHRDPRVAHLVAELLFNQNEVQLSTMSRIRSLQKTDLVVFINTLTDRIQHPFWSLHEPSSYPDWSSPPELVGRDLVEDAYRSADRGLGAMLSMMPEDTLVVVLSDHGVEASDGIQEEGEAGHRLEGIWVAAGPQIPFQSDPLELQVIDITPTVLSCLGAGDAEDFDGEVVMALCSGVTAGQGVVSYAEQTGAERKPTATRIDVSQEEQLKALGYIE